MVMLALALALGIGSSDEAPPAPAIVSPSSGYAAGGTAFTLTGTDFQPGATVTIGGVPATSVVWISSTSITGVSPAGTPGAQNVVVTNPDDQSVTLVGGFTFVATLTVTAITDNVGDTAGGVPVALTGTNFTGATGATIGGVALTAFSVVSAVSITGVTGAHAKGTVDIVVQHAAGDVTLTNGYEYFNLSSLASCVWWLRADLGITLNGANVSAWANQSGVADANRNAVQATAGNQPAYRASDAAYNGKPTLGTFNLGASNTILATGVWSATYSTFTMGAVGHAAVGLNRYFTFGSVSDFLALCSQGSTGHAAVLSGAAATNLIEVANSGVLAKCIVSAEFNGASSNLFVNTSAVANVSGTLAASTLGNEALSVGCRAGVAGTTAGVETIAEAWALDGIATAGEKLRVQKYLLGRYAKPPAISAVTDDVGDTAGGVPITISGAGFTGSTGATLGGVALTSFTVVNDATITGVTGARAKGTVDVVVQHPSRGSGTLTNGYEYFNPSSLASCVWWLRADLGITLNGANVSGWADQSGVGDTNRNAVQATAASQPAYRASDAAYNNKPTLGTFNIGAAHTVLATGVWNANYAAFTIGCVGNVNGGGSRYFTFGSSTDFQALIASASKAAAFSGASATSLIEAGTSAATAKCLTIAEFNGASSNLFVNATGTVSVTGTLTASSLGNKALFVGCRNGIAGTTAGVETIGELWALNGIATSGEKLRLRKYLNGRYAKSMTL
jgi:hypothetical protein